MKTNGVRLFALVAVFAMLVAGAAVVMTDSEVDAASEDTTYIHGQVTATQDYGTGTNVVVDGDLTIPAGMALIVSGNAKFTVNDGATITIKAGGQLVFRQTESATPVVKINGDIVAEGTNTDSTYENYIGAIVNNAPYQADGKAGVFLNGTVTLEKGAELVTSDAEGTVGKDKPTTISAYSGQGAIVLGTDASLNVTKKTSNISEIENQDIYMFEGSTFFLNGHSAKVNVMATASATYYTAGAVAINSSGMPAYGTSKNTSEITITVTNQTTPALTDAKDKDSRITLRQYVLNIEGTVAAGDAVSTAVGKSVSGNNTNATFYDVEHGEWDSSTSDYRRDKIEPMVSVTGTLNVEKESSLTIAANTYVIVSGELDLKSDVVNKETVASKATIYGTLEVTGTVTGTMVVTYSGNPDPQPESSNLTINGEIIVDGGNVAITTEEDITTLMGLMTSMKLYGTVFIDEGTDDSTLYIQDFDVAVNNAAAAEVEDVYVFSYGSQNRTTADGAIYNGAYVVDADITIPDGMYIYIWNSLVVAEGTTMTVQDGGEVLIYQNNDKTNFPHSQARDNDGKLWVEGKIVDYGGSLRDYEESAVFLYQVKKTTETETEEYVTYTTLKIALDESQSGEVIQLNGQIVIDENLTIPADVTVKTDDNGTSSAITLQGATLTVDGILEMADNATIKFTDRDGIESSLVVNNIVANADKNSFKDDTTPTAQNVTVPGAYFTGTIGDYDAGTKFVTSVEVAAANSASVEDSDAITIMGEVSVTDVTFTVGTDAESLNVIVDANAEFTADSVTLAGAVKFTVTGEFSGVVTSDVTAGTASIDFDKVSKATVEIDTEDNGESVTSDMTLTSDGIATGKIVITAGSVSVIGNNAAFYAINVASGATMVVPNGSVISTATPFYGKILTYVTNTSDNEVQKAAIKKIFNALGMDNDLPLYTSDRFQTLAGLIVDGTLVVEDGGQLDSLMAVINGTADVSSKGQLGMILSQISGTVNSENGAKVTLTVAVVDGTITGKVELKSESTDLKDPANIPSFILAMPGCDVSAAVFDADDNNQSRVDTTAVNVNGDLFATVMASQDNGNDVPLKVVLLFADIPGVDVETAKFYTDAAMTSEINNMTITGQEGLIQCYSELIDAMRAGTGGESALAAFVASLDGGADVGDFDNVYVSMDASKIAGTITTYEGVSVYIDGLSIENLYNTNLGKYVLSVGPHEITVQVQPGLTGTAVITVDGTPVSGNTFTLSGEQTDFKIVVSGDFTQSPVVIPSESNDSGMGLTDYLLIILVVLIVVMAIIVAMRLMRS